MEKIKIVAAVFLLSFGVIQLLDLNQHAFAAPADNTNNVDCSTTGKTKVTGYTQTQSGDQGCVLQSGKGDPALALCNNSQKDATKTDCDIVHKYLNPLIIVFSATAGIAVAAAIAYGGILYATAGGDAGKVAKAKDIIRNAILAMVAYIFLYAFLQFLIPGGLFQS